VRIKEEIAVQATGLAETGHGVAKADPGVEVHVVDLLPGERARVVIDHMSPHTPVAWAHIETRLGANAAERVTPPCPAFGRCGGCTWQHLAYRAQLLHKRSRVVDLLAASDVEPAVVDPVVAAPSERGYRNKGKYVVGPGPILGAYVPRTHRVVSTVGCTAVTEAIDRVAERVRHALAQHQLAAYDERHREGVLRYAVIRSAEDGGALVGLVTPSRAPRAPLQAVAAQLLSDPQVRGVLWLRNDLTTGVIFDADREPELLGGAPTMTESIAEVEIEVGITEFLQVNRAQAARIYDRVARIVADGSARRALDLYCGVGGFSFALARAGAHVVGVERQIEAVEAARHAAERAGLASAVQFRAASAEEVAELAAEYAPDVVVVDPPRKGLESEVRAALAAAAAPLLVYVSCEPRSLARDLADLRRDAGYRVERVLPFDLMPGTAHVEAVAVCRR